MRSAELLILALAGVWVIASLAFGCVFGIPAACRSRRHRRMFAPVPPGHAALDAELDLIALRLAPLYAGADVVRPGERHLLRVVPRPDGDDRRFAELPGHDDWRFA